MKKSVKKSCCSLVALLGLVLVIEFCITSKPDQTHSRKVHSPVDPSDSSNGIKSRAGVLPEEEHERAVELQPERKGKNTKLIRTFKNESAKLETRENIMGKIKKGKGDKRRGKDLDKSFRRIKTPAYISGHMPFVQPSRQDMVYINMVRDPIDRFISLYYFALNGDESGVKPRSISQIHENVTIDDYVRDGGSVQSKIFFHFDRDDVNDTDYNRDHLMQRIKGNIERYFILVGLTEEMKATIKLLEILLPDMLYGLHKAYTSTVDEKRDDYSTKNKVPPSNETIAILKEKLKDEYELYYFVKQNFSRLKQRFKVR